MTSLEKGLDIFLTNAYDIDLSYSQSALSVFVLACLILIPILFLND
jgi:hypothetical protein